MTKILMLLVILPTMAFAAAKPISDDIELANPEFAELIYNAIEKNTPAKTIRRAGGSAVSHEVGDGLICEKFSSSSRRAGSAFTCVLLKAGGWNDLGNHTYGSGSNGAFSEALFNALDVKVETDEAFVRKTIQYDIGDGRGGTERNLLVCTLPTPEGEQYGLKSSCQVIDAL